jgi:hypothetical protein
MNETSFSFVTSYLVRLDARRRPTLPSALLAEAGILVGSQDLVARVEGPGRVVLEDPTVLLGELQKSVAESKLERTIRGSLVDHLLEDRRSDNSLK